MEQLQYLAKIDRRQHIITMKDMFSYYDVTTITGKGNLRITYGRKDKRDLAVSIFNVYIAELFDVFIQGGIIFNMPSLVDAKMMFKTVPKEHVAKARSEGKLKALDPMNTGFTGICTVVRLKHNNVYYDTGVFLSENFQKTIYSNLNKRKNLLGKTDKFWDDFMEPVYSTFSDIDRPALDRLVKYGLRKLSFFLSKKLEVFINNTVYKEFIYFGSQTDKIKDIPLRYKLLTKQYIRKLRWHYNSKKEFTDNRYYALTEEEYAQHKAGELIEVAILKKLKEECLVGKPWRKYVMKTNTKTSKFSTLINDYDSSNDELIFIKP